MSMRLHAVKPDGSTAEIEYFKDRYSAYVYVLSLFSQGKLVEDKPRFEFTLKAAAHVQPRNASNPAFKATQFRVYNGWRQDNLGKWSDSEFWRLRKRAIKNTIYQLKKQATIMATLNLIKSKRTTDHMSNVELSQVVKDLEHARDLCESIIDKPRLTSLDEMLRP